MSNTEQKHIIEINGVKMEVDLRHATQVHDNLTIGTRVKVLVKEYSTPTVCSGVIVAFENFKSLPTIVVAYLAGSYNPEMKLAYVNTQSADKVEIVPDLDDTLPIERGRVVEYFATQRQKLIAQLDELDTKERYFNDRFGRAFAKFMDDKDGEAA